MAGADRLVLRNKVGLTAPLPLAYYEKIKAVDGCSRRRVAAAGSARSSARRKTRKSQFPMFATQPGPLLEVLSGI